MTANILRYRNYSHAENEVVLRSISKRTERSPRGWTTDVVETWTFEGILQGDSESELTTKITALENAYSVNGGNLTFGTTRHSILAAGSKGGTTVVSLEWVGRFGVEYVNLRSYQITVETRFDQHERELLDFRESLQSSGGLPAYVVQTLRNGPPIVQQTSPKTPYRATQNGFAVGYSRYPPPASPVFGSASPPLLDRSITNDSPDYYRGHAFSYRTSWSYAFLADFVLSR